MNLGEHIIFQQLGAGRFVAMTGAKNFIANGQAMLAMKIGRNAAGITHVRVKLNEKDLYNVEYIKIRGANMKVAVEVKDLYCEQLRGNFEENTGMALVL